MSKRFAWVLGAVVLVAIGLLAACGSKYSSSSDGLMLVGSQGSALVETFSFSLANGHIAEVSNPVASTDTLTCVLPGIPSSLVVDPAGAYAYAILTANLACTGSQTGIVSFKINSNGTIGTPGSVVTLNPVTFTLQGTQEQSPAIPSVLSMDAAGKFLFVADRSTASAPGAVSVFTISAGSVTEVTNSPFVPAPAPGTTLLYPPDITAVAATPTVFPANGANGLQNAVCSQAGNNPPTTQYLYAADFQNYVVWEFSVDMSTGALSFAAVRNFPTGTQPGGVAVDACNRFVFVSNYLSNNVNAYTICNGTTTSSSSCPNPADGRLMEVSGSPYSLPGGGAVAASGPGQVVVDPFGNFVYVLNMDSSSISPFQISPIAGTLTAKTPVATGLGPRSMAIRGDDNWLFVADYTAGTVSQYAITPATGVLSPLPAIQTDNFPWGVAVK